MDARNHDNEPYCDILNRLEYCIKKLQTFERFRHHAHLSSEDKMMLFILAVQKLKQEKGENEFIVREFRARDIEIRMDIERDQPWAFINLTTQLSASIEESVEFPGLLSKFSSVLRPYFVPMNDTSIECYYSLIHDSMSETLIPMIYADLWSNINDAKKVLSKHNLDSEERIKCLEIIKALFIECAKFDEMELAKEIKEQDKFALNRSEIVRKFILDRRDDIESFEMDAKIPLHSLNLSAVNLSSTDANVNLSDVIITDCNLRRTNFTGTVITAKQLKDNYNFSEVKGVDPAVIKKAVKERLTLLDQLSVKRLTKISKLLLVVENMDLLEHDLIKSKLTLFNGEVEIINHLFEKILTHIKSEQDRNPTEAINFEKQRNIEEFRHIASERIIALKLRYTQKYIDETIKKALEQTTFKRIKFNIKKALRLSLQSPFLIFTIPGTENSKKIHDLISDDDELRLLFENKRGRQIKQLTEAICINDISLLNKILSHSQAFLNQEYVMMLLDIAFMKDRSDAAYVILNTYENPSLALSREFIDRLMNYAYQHKNNELVILLQKFGISPDPLWAARLNIIEHLKSLPPLNECDDVAHVKARKDLLDAAVKCRSHEAMIFLWELDKKPDLLDIKSAIYLEQFHMVMSLYSQNKNYTDEERNTPIMLLMYVYNEFNSVNCLKLINKLIDRKINLEETNAEGKAALAIACENNLCDVAQALIDNNAELNPDHSEPALMCAIKANAVDSVNVLLENGVCINQSFNDTTALHLAVSLGRIDLVKLLLAHDANINLKDGEGRKPIDLATDIDIIYLLNKQSEISPSRFTLFHTHLRIQSARPGSVIEMDKYDFKLG